MDYKMKLSIPLTFGEEVANSVTHAIGALLMLALLPITAVHALQYHCCGWNVHFCQQSVSDVPLFFYLSFHALYFGP